MIYLQFPLNNLEPVVIIKDSEGTTVSTGGAVYHGIATNGMFWYTYDFTGTPGEQYNIIVDGGESIEDVEYRYINIWATEEVSTASGTDGGFTEEDRKQLFGTATKGDVSFTPAITFEEKQELFKTLFAIKNRDFPTTNMEPIAREMAKTNQIIGNLAKPSDLKVTVNVPPDTRIESIVTAISGLSEYLKPDNRLTGILTALEIISKKELDKEAIQAIESKIKNIEKEDIQSMEAMIKTILGEAITHLFDRMFPDKTPLQNKLYDLWVSKQ